MTIHGYDVSRWNKPANDPEGAAFAFVRVSTGHVIDASAEEHIARAVVTGVQAIGAYHALVLSHPAEQAVLFLGRCQGIGGRLMMAVDVEDLPAPAERWPRREYAEALHTFARYVTPVGVLGLYGSREFLEELHAAAPDVMTEIAATCPLWLAAWSPPWDVPRPWKRWTILQTGAEKGVDRDESELTIEELRAAFGLDGAPAGCAMPGP